MIDCNPVSTPADPHVYLSIQADDSECNAPISVPYKEAVGCLMFASLFTCPDISYAVHKAAKYPNVLDRCTGQLSREFFVILKRQLIMVCYIHNVLVHLYLQVIAIQTTEATLIHTNHEHDICSNSMTT